MCLYLVGFVAKLGNRFVLSAFFIADAGIFDLFL